VYGTSHDRFGSVTSHCFRNADKRSSLPVVAAAAAAILHAAGAARAAPISDVAAYPSRPIRIIVGFPPGSGTDMLARFVGARLTDRLQQQVVVDNRPGANGIIASELTVKAAPDGYTLQFMSTSHTMNAAVYKLSFDAVASFTPVSMLGAGPLVLVTHPSFPANNVKELIELAKAKPDAITYAVSGTGGINHFAGALFSHAAGIRLLDVPYRGGPQALTDVIAGQVQLMFATLSITHRQVNAGKLKALGVSSAKRTAVLPTVPTIAESGVRGYEMNIWWGVLAPARLPDAIALKLGGEIAGVLREPESMRQLEAQGAEPMPMGRSQFARVLVSEVETWRRVARESNIKAE
ncbi:MAG TPA: tripartite tricarboxylate transporter substrate binding protein, partial [Burkholderiales bacterium]|nr:tripartite tricarboxylate transporter substrate binding protein [Burkholderiales bacterium]